MPVSRPAILTRMARLGGLLALFLFLWSGQRLAAQVSEVLDSLPQPADTLSAIESEAWESYGDSLETDSLALDADSLALDSLVAEDGGDSLYKDGKYGKQPVAARDTAKKVVPPRTVLWDLARLRDNLNYVQQVAYRLQEVMEPDLLWRQDGHYNWLGQIGKPYRRSIYGFDGSNFRGQGVFINPYTGAEDAYIPDPEASLLYFDTRTPYINVYFGQGKADLSQLRVDLSQNVHPFVNVGLWYYRRVANGVYNSFTTDHQNLGATVNVRTPNERYQAFLSGTVHDGKEQINGGVEQNFFLSELDSTYEELFGKTLVSVALNDAVLRRRNQAFTFFHSYRISGDTLPYQDTTWAADTVVRIRTAQRPNRLRIYNGFLFQVFENEFSDVGIDPGLLTLPFPVYPTMDTASLLFHERFLQNRGKGYGGVAYRFKTNGFEMGHRAEIGLDVIDFYKNRTQRVQAKFNSSYWGDLRITPGPFEVKADAQVHNTVTNLFKAPENYAELGGSLGLPKAVEDYTYKVPGPPRHEKDSIEVKRTHRPFSVELRSIVYGRNPTLQQAYGVGAWENRFQADSSLRNMRMSHVRLGGVYRTKTRLGKNGEIPGTEIGLSAFASRSTQYIYYDSSLLLRQTGRDTFLQWLGVEARFRIHFGRFYLENRTVLQSPSSNDSLLAATIGTMQPPLYGKASLYYENPLTKFGGVLRIGIDYYYTAAYNVPVFDGPSQQFYPQTRFQQPAYHRVDAYFGAKVKRVFLYLKLAHANEGLLARGYFSTMLYPMMDRNFMVGINWNFFD
jgi:Putative porin